MVGHNSGQSVVAAMTILDVSKETDVVKSDQKRRNRQALEFRPA